MTALLFLLAAFSLTAAEPTAATFPVPKFLGDPANHGRNVQRTMRLLATSTPEHRNTVRVLFYGQSITEQAWSKTVAEDLRVRFPNANLVIENRALGGFASQILVRTAETDLYPFQPDLLIFHVFGAHDKYEDIIRRTRERTCAEILIQNDHLSAKDDWRNEETDPGKVTTKQWNSFMNYKHLPAVVAKYGTGLVDQRAIWKRYLADNGLESQALLRDGVHLNPQGESLMAECVKAHLVYRPELGPAIAEEWVKTIEIGKDVQWQDGKLRVEFEGARVEAVVRSSRDSGPLLFRIDGRRLSEFSELYGFTRALPKPGGKWPAIAPLHAEQALLVEHWSMQVHRADADGKRFTFSICGSKTGPDGEGTSDEKFVSKSGRVVIEPADWNAAYALGLAGVKPVPERFTVNWSVIAHFTNELSFATIQPNDRLPAQPPHDDAVNIATGLPNTKHTLEITGDSNAPIRALRIYRPPLGRDGR